MSENLLRWEECSEAFKVDGSLRDLYIFDTTLNEWDEFLQFLKFSQYSVEYSIDDVTAEIPISAHRGLNDRKHSHKLVIRFDTIRLNCFFFMENEIELDIDPKEINKQEDLDALLEFISMLGNTLSKEVFITEENSPEEVWIHYSPKQDRVYFTEHS